MPVFLLYTQNRLFTFAYGDIPYKDVFYVSTTHRVGLDTDNTVQFGAVHLAVLYPYIMASSGYFASYGYSCMSVLHATFTYDDVFAGNVPVTSVFIASRFYGYAVVARVKVAVFYQHVFARFRIASVIVRPWLCIFTPFMVTFSDSSGWISQNGERLMVNPSSRMFLHLYKLMNCGRIPFAFSKMRSFTGIESSFIWYSKVFSLTVSPFSDLMPRMRCSANQLSVLACPSSFPFR